MKVYCQLCCYCYDKGYTTKSYCRCHHPRHLVDNFYGRNWDNIYCDHKNRNNDCPDFKLLPSVERKMKRKEWFKSIRTKLYNKGSEFIKNVVKLITKIQHRNLV